MDNSKIVQTFREGGYTEQQRAALEHLAQWAPGWCGCRTGQKTPVRQNGRNGDAADPTAAMALPDALGAMERRRWGVVSVMIVCLHPDAVGLDFDHVIEDGVPNEAGREVLRRFSGTYIEVSPSGTGLRAYCLGRVPDGTKANVDLEEGVKFEVYPSGKGRHLRATGDIVAGTVGEVRPCQDGIDWLVEVFRSKSIRGAGSGEVFDQSTDNDKASSKDEASQKSPNTMHMAHVWEELATLRPDKDAAAVVEALQVEASKKPRSKIAEALRGGKAPWKDDWSSADQFICCEAIRRGAGSTDDVVDVWESTGLADRDKFKRRDYRTGTAEKAARSVLQDLRNKATGVEQAKPAPKLPEGLAQVLALSGDVLTQGKGGRLAPDPGNVVILFRNLPELAGLLGFNELAQAAWRLQGWQVFDRLAAGEPGPVNDDDITRVGMYFERAFGMRVDRKELMRAIEAAARDASYDPLADKLRALGTAWDGVPRLDSWLVKWAKVDDTGAEEFVSLVGRRFMVGAVARALEPGCKMDTVLAVEGAGGGGKSTMFQVLADVVAPGLFTDGVHDVSSTSAVVEATGGRWIVEIAELAGVRRAADIEALKAALTRTRDTHRRPYDVMSREFLRRFVFVATTNRSEYLNDPSGALLRRFWPVRTRATERDPIDLQGLADVAPQLWAEAVTLYLRGEVWHLGAGDGPAYTQWTKGREQRRESLAWEDELVDYLAEWVQDYFAGEAKGREMRDIARAIGDMRTVEGDNVARLRLADTLRAMGLEVAKSGGKKRWRFTAEGAKRAALCGEAERAATVAA